MPHHADVHTVCLCAFVLSADAVGWEKGVLYAEGQNLARFLMEAPANHITPTAFANIIKEKLVLHAERVTIKKRSVLHSSSLRIVKIIVSCSSILQVNLL